MPFEYVHRAESRRLDREEEADKIWTRVRQRALGGEIKANLSKSKFKGANIRNCKRFFQKKEEMKGF